MAEWSPDLTREDAEAPATAVGRAMRTPADTLAFAVSALASPFIILPLFACIITAQYSASRSEFFRWASLAAGFSTGIPLLYILIGVKSGAITDVHVMRRDQRGGPFLIAMISSAAGAGVLYCLGAPLPVVVLGIGITLNGIVFALITLRWKISMHPSVFAAAVLCATFLVSHTYASLLLFLPAIIWARSRRARHSVPQGLAAIVVAAAVTLVVLGVFGFVS